MFGSLNKPVQIHVDLFLPTNLHQSSAADRSALVEWGNLKRRHFYWVSAGFCWSQETNAVLRPFLLTRQLFVPFRRSRCIMIISNLRCCGSSSTCGEGISPELPRLGVHLLNALRLLSGYHTIFHRGYLEKISTYKYIH